MYLKKENWFFGIFHFEKLYGSQVVTNDILLINQWIFFKKEMDTSERV
jgi:hypothetical protein